MGNLHYWYCKEEFAQGRLYCYKVLSYLAAYVGILPKKLVDHEID